MSNGNKATTRLESAQLYVDENGIQWAAWQILANRLSRAMSVHAGKKELAEAGFARAQDGVLLDNRDGFYDEHEDFLATYDTRTRIPISYELLNRLLEALIYQSEGMA